MSDGRRWPRVSIVTPSCNQGRFIEETIRSILLQGYPDLEYILIDASSTDESINILRKYERWLTYWVSEPDRGQAHALKKGFDKARGELLGWTNADDLLARGAVRALAEVYVRHAHYGIYAGTVENFRHTPSEERREVVGQHNISFMSLLLSTYAQRPRFHQPGIFFTSHIYQQAGGVDPTYQYRMDYDLLLRMLDKGARTYYLDEVLAYFRKHALSKTGRRTFAYFVRVFDETSSVTSRYVDRLSEEDRGRLRLQRVNDLLHGAYYGLMSAQPKGAAKCLRLAVILGRSSIYRALFLSILQAAIPRLERLLRTR
jgi:glycosyltransferase involved in cell wall biosynthesis